MLYIVMFMKRFCDYLIASTSLLLLAPILLLVALAIRIDSKGNILFRQWRVGKNGRNFMLLKFRTMYANSVKGKLLTVSNHDSRITRLGIYLRKYKIDELPQLLNVLTGDMSIVGPRPELREFVKLYTKSQQLVLQTKPGMTDLASLVFFDENELLKNSDDPEGFYVKEILPLKIRLNRVYLLKSTVGKYFSIIGWTLLSIFHITNSRLRHMEAACKSRIYGNLLPKSFD